MLPKFELQICSTGEVIFSEYSEMKMRVWQNIVEKELLKDGRRNAALKEAIKTRDTIVGWTNYDDLVVLLQEKISDICAYVFEGYDLYFEKRIDNAS